MNVKIVYLPFIYLQVVAYIETSFTEIKRHSIAYANEPRYETFASVKALAVTGTSGELKMFVVE